LREVRLALLEADVNVGVEDVRRGRQEDAPAKRCCGLTPEQHFSILSIASWSAWARPPPLDVGGPRRSC
jgi:hypothetical protein